MLPVAVDMAHRNDVIRCTCAIDFDDCSNDTITEVVRPALERLGCAHLVAPTVPSVLDPPTFETPLSCAAIDSGSLEDRPDSFMSDASCDFELLLASVADLILAELDHEAPQAVANSDMAADACHCLPLMEAVDVHQIAALKVSEYSCQDRKQVDCVADWVGGDERRCLDSVTLTILIPAGGFAEEVSWDVGGSRLTSYQNTGTKSQTHRHIVDLTAGTASDSTRSSASDSSSGSWEDSPTYVFNFHDKAADGWHGGHWKVIDYCGTLVGEGTVEGSSASFTVSTEQPREHDHVQNVCSAECGGGFRNRTYVIATEGVQDSLGNGLLCEVPNNTMVHSECNQQPCLTCEDGLQNGDEADVDCGGSCEPCCNVSACQFCGSEATCNAWQQPWGGCRWANSTAGDSRCEAERFEMLVERSGAMFQSYLANLVPRGMSYCPQACHWVWRGNGTVGGKTPYCARNGELHKVLCCSRNESGHPTSFSIQKTICREHGGHWTEAGGSCSGTFSIAESMCTAHSNESHVCTKAEITASAHHSQLTDDSGTTAAVLHRRALVWTSDSANGSRLCGRDGRGITPTAAITELCSSNSNSHYRGIDDKLTLMMQADNATYTWKQSNNPFDKPERYAPGVSLGPDFPGQHFAKQGAQLQIVYATCKKAFDAGVVMSGLYNINGEQVYCDMVTAGGGWSMIMNIAPTDGNSVGYNNQEFWTAAQPYGNPEEMFTTDWKSSLAYMMEADEVMIQSASLPRVESWMEHFEALVPFDLSDLPNNNFCRSCDQDNCDDCDNDMWRIRDGSCGWNTGQYHYGGGGIGWVTVDLGEPVAVGAVKVNGYQGSSHDPAGPWEIRGSNDGTTWTQVGTCSRELWAARDVGCTDMDQEDFCFMPSTSTTPYQKYRIWSQGWSNGWLIMVELQVMVVPQELLDAADEAARIADGDGTDDIGEILGWRVWPMLERRTFASMFSEGIPDVHGSNACETGSPSERHVGSTSEYDDIIRLGDCLHTDMNPSSSGEGDVIRLASLNVGGDNNMAGFGSCIDCGAPWQGGDRFMGMDRAACNRDDHGGACHHSQVRYLEGANGQRGDCEGNYCNGGTYGGGSTIPGWNSRFFVRSAGATGWEGDQQEITGMEHFEALVPFDQSNLQEAVLGLSPAQCKRLCSANATCPAYNFDAANSTAANSSSGVPRLLLVA